jgi:hypothetical protein
MSVYANRLKIEATRFGSTRNGMRISNDINLDRQMVPNNVVREWTVAAWTICLDVGAGFARRWKYHWLTVAAVTARWTPAMTPNDHRYTRTKNAPSHQLLMLIMKEFEPDMCPPRKTRVNMSIQIHVHETMRVRLPRPRSSNSALALRIRHANSRTLIALPIA